MWRSSTSSRYKTLEPSEPKLASQIQNQDVPKAADLGFWLAPSYPPQGLVLGADECPTLRGGFRGLRVLLCGSIEAARATSALPYAFKGSAQFTLRSWAAAYLPMAPGMSP